MENLIPRLCKFIDIEYDTEIASTDQLWKLPLEERVTKGEAIQNLKAQFITMAFGGSKMVIGVHFTCDSNISKFREGTPVIVSGHGIKFKGEITSEERNSIEIGMNQFDGYPSVPEHLLKSSGWVIDKAKTDIRHILKQPIQNLPLNTSRYNLINGILDGSILPELDELARSKAEQLASTAQLNESQRKAFIEAFIAKNYYLIQGPPGTGKTWVLAYLAAAFASEGKNVLITAFTHTGINNALQKISKVTGYKKTAKLGKKHQSENLDYDGANVSIGEDLRAHGYDQSTKGVIIGATAYAPNTKKLKGFPFDVIIFDEASQLTVPLAMAAMAAGTKFIFIGDHKQLPPIISPQQQDVELSKSIFEYPFQKVRC